MKADTSPPVFSCTFDFARILGTRLLLLVAILAAWGTGCDDTRSGGVIQSVPETQEECEAAHWMLLEDPTGFAGRDGYHAGAPHLLCILECESDQDCPKTFPFCTKVGLYAGGDALCNEQLLGCSAVDMDECRF